MPRQDVVTMTPSNLPEDDVPWTDVNPSESALGVRFAGIPDSVQLATKTQSEIQFYLSVGCGTKLSVESVRRTMDGGECPADGDIVQTQVIIDMPIGDANVLTNVSLITTEVEAVPSCDLSNVSFTVPANGLFLGTLFRVDVILIDIDGLPISISNPAVTLHYSGATHRKMPMVRQATLSNHFAATVSFPTVGMYTLHVEAAEGWMLGNTSNCTIGAEWAVEVAEEDKPTTPILAGVMTSSLIIVIGLLLYLRHRGKKFRNIFLLVRPFFLCGQVELRAY